jgi:hypothetical protein
MNLLNLLYAFLAPDADSIPVKDAIRECRINCVNGKSSKTFNKRKIYDTQKEYPRKR